MKRTLFLLACVAFMAACSSELQPKMITPTSTEFTSGELAKYVKIVNGPAELSFAEKDGAIKTQYIRLTVKLQAEDYYSPKDHYSGDYRDLSFTSLLSIATINLVDDYGTIILNLSIRSDEILKLKKLISGEIDNDADYFLFEGEYHASKDARTWFNEVTHFAPYLTGDIVLKRNTEEPVVRYESTRELTLDNDKIDKLLDEYEAFVDKYISILKTANSGEVSASEYASLISNAERLDNKISEEKGEMNESQLDRCTRILNKFEEAGNTIQ